MNKKDLRVRISPQKAHMLGELRRMDRAELEFLREKLLWLAKGPEGTWEMSLDARELWGEIEGELNSRESLS